MGHPIVPGTLHAAEMRARQKGREYTALWSQTLAPPSARSVTPAELLRLTPRSLLCPLCLHTSQPPLSTSFISRL